MVERRLEDTRERLQQLTGPDWEQARAAEEERWRMHVHELREEHPDTVVNLKALVFQIQVALDEAR